MQRSNELQRILVNNYVDEDEIFKIPNKPHRDNLVWKPDEENLQLELNYDRRLNTQNKNTNLLQ